MSLALAVLMLTAPCRSATPRYDETKVVAYAKVIDVAALDSTLKSQPLDELLRLGPARLEKLNWRMSDCDLKPDYREPSTGYPLCVRLGYQRGNVSGWAIITVGTKRKGIVEPPRFEYAVVSTRSDGGVHSETADKLSDLPHVISKLLSKTR
ncbi:MAG TPA: hypothetical protein VG323_01820 [Thermoanaerobaculia bacterium]|nr:hypothetical protein [Thermoanaerobaculia bacterium]